MTLPQNATLVIEQGVDNYLWWGLELPDGTTADLADLGDGYTTGWLQVRTKHLSEGGELLLNLTTSNGGVVIQHQTDDDGEEWSGYLFVAASKVTEPWGEAVYELRAADPAGRRMAIFKGVAILSPATVDEEEA